MKILFICNKIDLPLKYKLDELEKKGNNISCLLLLEYKLFKDGKYYDLEPKSNLEFLEKNKKLRVINRTLKRKKLLQKLKSFDTIVIYKNCRSLLFLKNEITSRCKNYDIFINDEILTTQKSSFKSHFYHNLYKDAKYLILNSEKKQNQFKSLYGYSDKTHVLLDGNALFDIADDIDEAETQEYKTKLEVQSFKNIIYCDMHANFQKQKKLIDQLETLPIETLQETIFLFPMLHNDFENRKEIKNYLQDKNFNFILINKLISDREKVLLFKVSNKAIILSEDEQMYALQLALYTKTLVYLFEISNLDNLYIKNHFYLDKFEEFLTDHEKSDTQEHIIEELFNKNKHMINTLFSPKKTINQLELILS